MFGCECCEGTNGHVRRDSLTARLSFYSQGKNLWDKKAQLTSLLLYLAGEAVQDVMESLELTIDEDGEEDIFSQTIDALDQYFIVAVNPTYERHVFRKMSQKTTETVSQYVTRLKTQAQFCSFADCTDQIRDQLLQTMLDGKLKESLLETVDINLDVCLQKARQKEIAQAQARSMQPPGASAASSSSVHRLHQTQKSFAGRGSRSSETAQPPTSLPRATPQDRSQGGGKCYACGRHGHFAGNPNCPARGKRCSKCTKRGHFAAQCQSIPGKERTTKKGHIDDLSSSGVGQVQLPADTTPGAEYQLDSVAEVGHDPGEGAADPIFGGVHINDQELLMELDTGAKMVVIPEKIWKDKWPELSLSSCDVRLSTYDGTIVLILGEAFVSVNYSGKCIDLRAIVVKSGKHALLGRGWLHAFRPHWMNSIHLLHPSLKSVNVEPSEKNVEHAENLDAVRDFAEVLDERLGCISGCEATIHLQDGAVPKCIPARPVPYALRSKVDNELDRLEREGVIHKIEFAECASPIVVV